MVLKYSRPKRSKTKTKTKTLAHETKTKTKTCQMGLETVSRPRHVSRPNITALLAKAFEDSQPVTYETIQLHAIQLTYTCNDKQQIYLTCLQINNAYNKLHDPEWVKKTQAGVAHTFSINC